MIFEVAGYLSGLAMVVSFIPYIRNILLGKTKPERMSWFIWVILGLITFSSQLAKGGSFSLIMNIIQILGDLSIFILAIKWGIGGFLKRDFFALIGVGVGLLLWYLTKEAAIALIIAILIDATGAVLTIIKSYEQPTTETISLWLITSLAGLLACVAVGSFNIILLIYPFYIFVVGLAVIISVKLGFRRVTKQRV